MSQAENVRPEPNLRVFTEDERRAIIRRWYDLDEAGRHEEALAVLGELPILPDLAQVSKEINGIDALIASGLNLSRAVEAFGEGWLER